MLDTHTHLFLIFLLNYSGRFFNKRSLFIAKIFENSWAMFILLAKNQLHENEAVSLW